MRRDWNELSTLLGVIEKLAGHPNLRGLRDEANDDLNDIAAQPAYSVEYPQHVQDPIDHSQPEPKIEAEVEPQESETHSLMRRRV